MRFVCLSTAVFLSLLLVSGCATSSQQAQLAAKQEQIATQIQKLQTTVENLNKDMDALQKTKRTSYGSSESKDQAAERIAKIEFPADRSAENLKHYINEIIVASQGLRRYSSQDPQVDMLTRVGADNLNLLIDAMPVGSGAGMEHHHLEQAIKLLADDQHKALILKELPIRRRLVSVVIYKRWEQDARDILVSELEGAASDQLPTDWFKAVASLQDPETYGALTNYFAKSINAGYLYQYVSILPGIQLDEAVAVAWARIKTINGSHSTARMAVVAISYGHQDAADTLINLLKNPPDSMSSSVNPRPTLMRHLDTTGSNAELITWYEANKDSLVFDPESKKFKLKS